jgi:hypothetical protein
MGGLPTSSAVSKVACLGHHAPRQCDIATFSRDLRDAAVETTDSVSPTAAAATMVFLGLLRRARMPIVTTLQTVLERPDASQRRDFRKLIDTLSEFRPSNRSKLYHWPFGAPDHNGYEWLLPLL